MTNLTAGLVRCVQLATSLGYTVSTGPTPSGAMGQCRYSERRIWVDAPTPWQGLLTLLHELGHAVAGQRLGIERAAAEDEPASERRAYLYGWAVAVHCGCTHLLSREDWRRFHAGELARWRGVHFQERVAARLVGIVAQNVQIPPPHRVDFPRGAR